jgi:predicted NUDIX family NTP pyrophosphohydrolase
VPPPRSAGILLYRQLDQAPQVLLIRPGGPYWRGRQQGAWMIPKGAVEAGETSREAALREFEEELGCALSAAPLPLCQVRQAGGKWVEAFAVEGDFDVVGLKSAEFEIEWPPRSGRRQRFPEAEEARWMTIDEARQLMLPSQLPILDALEARLAGS